MGGEWEGTSRRVKRGNNDLRKKGSKSLEPKLGDRTNIVVSEVHRINRHLAHPLKLVCYAT